MVLLFEEKFIDGLSKSPNLAEKMRLDGAVVFFLSKAEIINCESEITSPTTPRHAAANSSTSCGIMICSWGAWDEFTQLNTASETMRK